MKLIACFGFCFLQDHSADARPCQQPSYAEVSDVGEVFVLSTKLATEVGTQTNTKPDTIIL